MSSQERALRVAQQQISNQRMMKAMIDSELVTLRAEIERLKAIVDAIPDKDDPLGWVRRLAVMMDQQHILVLGADGWSIEHPITCRLDGQAPLHECPHHIAVVEHVDMVLDEWGEGSYRIWLDDTIWCGFDGTPT